MKLYDITQELFSGEVYPGDVPPTFERPLLIEKGDPCNLTVLHMCAHNGTHADAPRHFYKDGMAIDQMELSKFIGYCTVVNFERVQDKNKLKTILENCENKLLLKGNGTVTLDMAKLLNQYQIQLIGVESQSVGEVNAPMDVHLELLGKEVVILEGLRLGEVPEGNYLLSAAPLKLGESDGAPCRAVLIELE